MDRTWWRINNEVAAPALVNELVWGSVMVKEQLRMKVKEQMSVVVKELVSVTMKEPVCLSVTVRVYPITFS